MGFLRLEVGPESTKQRAEPKLEVFVLFTDVPSTMSALRTAGQLAEGLSARIRLLALHCVPYPLAVDQPPVSVGFLDQRYRAMTNGCTLETAIEIFLCRDRWEALKSRLHPASVVIVGWRGRWWRPWWLTPEDRLVRKLRAEGHHVVRTSKQGNHLNA
jgi:hypothetical protein